MKKTSTRLAGIGGLIVLGAFAIGLAQHDSRKREPAEPLIEAALPEASVPIPVDAADEPWGVSSRNLVVRANNGKPSTRETPQSDEAPQPENPLRVAMAAPFAPDSSVVPAGAEAPIDPPAGPLPSTNKTTNNPTPGSPTTDTKPPSWLGDSAKPAAADSNQTKPAALPTLPTFPIGNPGTAPLPSLPSSAPGPAAMLSSNVGDMSDTQRGIMRPTELGSEPPADSTANQPQGMPQSMPVAGMPSAALEAAAPSSLPGITSSGQIPATLGPPQAPSFQPSQALSNGPSPTGSNSNIGPLGGQPAPTAASPYGSPSSGGSRPTGLAPPSAEASSLPAPKIISGAPNDSQPAALGSQALGSWPSSRADNNSERTPAALTSSARGHSNLPTELLSNEPGSRYLDGSQNPSLLIQKRAPEEIQVGKKATFVIAVRNAGNATAYDVRVVDRLPRGVRFEGAAPSAQPDAQGILSWSLGEMAAGEERTITLQLVPEVQGEIGSNALVYFAAQASVRTVATLPQLEIQLSELPEMLIGSRQHATVIVKNTGTGVAHGVRLEADLPEHVQHDSGEALLGIDLGDMRPGESQPINLDFTAALPGQSSLAIRAVSDDGAGDDQEIAVNVLAPRLTAAIEGPKLRYLERQATYRITVRNEGTAVATNLDFVIRLPAGLKFNAANNDGSYDPAQHSVQWGLWELPAGAPATVELTVLPVELGPQPLSFAATADLNLRAEAKSQLNVDGLAELAFTIGQDNGTIEVGASSTYSVQITNVGSKPDRDVRLAVALPNGSQLMAVDAPVNYRVEGSQIVFEPVPEMRNKDQQTIRFQVQHNQPGTQIVRTQLTSANWPSAVIKEEGTLVYNDQN